MDLTSIQVALGLASTAATATGQAVAAAEAMKKLFSSGKPTDDEGAKLVSSLASQLTAANMLNLQLSEALKKIGQDLKQQDDFEQEKQHYELFQTNEGDMVYRIKSEHRGNQPDHYICPPCLSTNKTFSFITGEGEYKICQCNRDHVFRFKSSRPSGASWGRGSKRRV